MNLQLLSDLHLEAHPDFGPVSAPGADLLVLAGDIGSYQSGSSLAARGDPDFGLARFSPRLGWPVPVLFVPGNHEYDGMDFDETHSRLRLGLIWLERETVALGGVRFVGTTLWSDFDALGPPTHDSATTLTQQLRSREKALRAANYYLRKTGGTRGGAPFLAEAVREQALVCQQWLRATLAEPFDGPTVVVTHFAPSFGCTVTCMPPATIGTTAAASSQTHLGTCARVSRRPSFQT